MIDRGMKVGVGALCTQWAVPPGANQINQSRGLQGFPRWQWSTCLMMSLLYLLLAVADAVSIISTQCKSHWKDLMEILTGFAAMTLSSMVFFKNYSPQYWIISCLRITSDASVILSATLFQPSVSFTLNVTKKKVQHTWIEIFPFHIWRRWAVESFFVAWNVKKVWKLLI